MNELRPAFIRAAGGPVYNMAVYEEEGVGDHLKRGDKFGNGRFEVLSSERDRIIYRVDDIERDREIARDHERMLSSAEQDRQSAVGVL